MTSPNEHLPSRFVHDQNGGIAILTGLLLAVLMGLGGSAIDYSRATAARSNMQNSLDLSMISAAKADTSGGQTSRSVAELFFAQNISSNAYAGSATITRFEDANGVMEADAELDMPTSLMAILGIPSIPIKVTSKLQTSIGNVEVVLVLDNTNSMSGSKLDDLKTAATELIGKLEIAAGDGDTVNIGVVPFAQYVNVGLSRRDEPWLSVLNDYTETVNTCTTSSPVISSTNCRTETFTADDDGVPYTYEAEVCDNVYGDPVETCADDTNSYTWRGCVTTRDDPLNRTPTVDTGDATALVVGKMDAYCPSKITPLTSVFSTVTSQINSLTATGETYIPGGLIWGWRLLQSAIPFTEAADDTDDSVRKIMILMTDGTNTKSQNPTSSSSYPGHTYTDQNEADDVTAQLCQDIKDNDIEIFAVTFDVSDSSIIDLMRDCATGEPYYFDTDTGSELTAAFEAIGKKLGKVRISG